MVLKSENILGEKMSSVAIELKLLKIMSIQMRQALFGF